MAQKSRATLASDIASLFADNTSGDISPEDLRTILIDLSDSVHNKTTDGEVEGVSVSAGASDAGKVPLLNGDGLLDESFLTAAIDPNLMGWWKLNEGTGTTAVDSSPSGNDGTLVNTPTWGTGPDATGDVVFDDASNEYIDFGNPAELQITGDLTISCWVKLATLQSCMLIAKDGDTGGRAYTLDYEHGVVDGFRMYVDGGGTNKVVNGVTPAVVGVWQHVVGVFDAGTIIPLYIDGALDASSDVATHGAPPGSIPAATANVLAGRRTYSGFEGPMDGEMDDIRIYNRVLDAGEIAALYAAGAE